MYPVQNPQYEHVQIHWVFKIYTWIGIQILQMTPIFLMDQNKSSEMNLSETGVFEIHILLYGAHLETCSN